jgi:hypothetical protein
MAWVNDLNWPTPGRHSPAFRLARTAEMQWIPDVEEFQRRLTNTLPPLRSGPIVRQPGALKRRSAFRAPSVCSLLYSSHSQSYREPSRWHNCLPDIDLSASSVSEAIFTQLHRLRPKGRPMQSLSFLDGPTPKNFDRFDIQFPSITVWMNVGSSRRPTANT